MNTKIQSPALMDEYPLLVYPSLAAAMGINKAVVFQQLHFLLCNQKTAKNEYVFINDHWWVYNTYKEWKETYFSWLAPVTLKGIFRQLEADKLIISMQSVKHKSDRRKWYTIDYKAWESYQNTIGYKISHEPTDKKYPMDGIKNIPSNGQKISDGYSETPTETPTERVRKPPPPIHSYIQAWAEARGIDAVNIGAPVYTQRDVRQAKRMAKWAIPATVEEIKAAVKVSKVQDYPFAWLEADIPKARLAHVKSEVKPPAPFNPDQWQVPELEGL